MWDRGKLGARTLDPLDMLRAMERFRILDHGCKVNRYDGEVVRAELRRFGLIETDGDGPADLVVLNACAVTDRAVQKGRQALRRLRREHPGARLVVTGCMTATDRTGYGTIDSGVLAVPSGERETLRPRLEEFLGDAVPARPDGALALDDRSFEDRTRAFLKVEDGCDAKCAFCVIPRIRGGVRSRLRHEILAESTALIGRGFKELVLCGIHLGHYGRDTSDCVLDLVRAVAALPGEFRVRLSSLEITEVDEPLAETIAREPKIAPHLHVPLQSGDDGVLRAMRRPYTAARYLERIAAVEATNPALALTTDVIVGFPGETEADFRRTIEVARQARFSRIHVFPFSPRAGTEAAARADRVPVEVVRSRVARLLREERRLRIEYDGRLIGTEATVLVESSDGRESSGLSERYRRIRLPGGYPTSTFVRCRVVGRSGDDLIGEGCS